ncbi:MAG TPA: methyltransferase [Acidobacteriota bacterium]|nr:methyltransferase [Acidobacteriota bacterium]
MEPFRYHVFVCDQQKPEWVPCCSARGSAGVIEALRREIATHRLTDAVQVTVCGSLGLCESGVNMVVYPEGIWYSKVTTQDVPEIVRSHIVEGNVVERLARIDTQELRAEILSNREKMNAGLRAKDAAGTIPDDLAQTIRGFQDSRVILTAIELDVFSALGSGASASEVAGRIGTNPRATEMLLNALSALRLVRKADNRFHNTRLSGRYFAADSPDYARDSLMHSVNLWTRWSRLTECVKAGTTVGSDEVSDRGTEWTTYFIAAMDRNARERAPMVVRAVGAEGKRRMLDVAGGSAAYSIAFCRANPVLEAEVFDLPAVVPLTRRYIETAGLGGRIRVRAGDLLSDTLGGGFDLALVSQICHSFSEEENLDLLKKCRAALTPGGTIAIQEFIPDADRTGPKFAVLFALNMLVGTRAGNTYSEEEICGWLRQAGFRDIRRVRLPGPSGLLLAVG